MSAPLLYNLPYRTNENGDVGQADINRLAEDLQKQITPHSGVASCILQLWPLLLQQNILGWTTEDQQALRSDFHVFIAFAVALVQEDVSRRMPFAPQGLYSKVSKALESIADTLCKTLCGNHIQIPLPLYQLLILSAINPHPATHSESFGSDEMQRKTKTLEDLRNHVQSLHSLVPQLETLPPANTQWDAFDAFWDNFSASMEDDQTQFQFDPYEVHEDEDKPIFLNAKQFNRIVKRRIARQQLDERFRRESAAVGERCSVDGAQSQRYHCQHSDDNDE